MQTKFYHWLLLSIIPFIRVTTYYTSLRGKSYHEGYKVLEPGHIMCAVDTKKLTHFLIPGNFCHAALCVDKRPGLLNFEVAEMTHENYTKSDFFDIVKESERVVILKCLDWDERYVQGVIASCLTFKDAVYDVQFDLGVKALYCSELIYQSDKLTAQMLGVTPRLNCDLSDLAGIGRPYISPDGIAFSKNVLCVWDSAGQLTGKTGPEMEVILGKK